MFCAVILDFSTAERSKLKKRKLMFNILFLKITRVKYINLKFTLNINLNINKLKLKIVFNFLKKFLFKKHFKCLKIYLLFHHY